MPDKNVRPVATTAQLGPFELEPCRCTESGCQAWVVYSVESRLGIGVLQTHEVAQQVKTAMNYLPPSAANAEIEKLRAQLAMHPNGQCACAGEGMCDWCQLAAAKKEIESLLAQRLRICAAVGYGAQPETLGHDAERILAAAKAEIDRLRIEPPGWACELIRMENERDAVKEEIVALRRQIDRLVTGTEIDSDRLTSTDDQLLETLAERDVARAEIERLKRNRDYDTSGLAAASKALNDAGVDCIYIDDGVIVLIAQLTAAKNLARRWSRLVESIMCQMQTTGFLSQEARSEWEILDYESEATTCDKNSK